jgi:hypothetical protein
MWRALKLPSPLSLSLSLSPLFLSNESKQKGEGRNLRDCHKGRVVCCHGSVAVPLIDWKESRC